MIEEIRNQYELLHRFNPQTGVYQGTHKKFYEIIKRDGVIISQSESKAFGVGEGKVFSLTDVMDQLTADVILAHEQLQAQLATSTESLTTAEADTKAAQEQLAAITAERDALLAQVAELTAPPTGRLLKVGDYRDRFTKAEQAEVLKRAYGGDENCQFLLMKMQTNTDGIDLDSTDVINGLAHLTAIDILNDGRAAEIRG